MCCANSISFLPFIIALSENCAAVKIHRLKEITEGLLPVGRAIEEMKIFRKQSLRVQQ